MAKHLQILRNQTISADRSTAKANLLAKLAELNDGEVALNRYQDGEQVKVLLGFNNTVGENTKQFVFDADAIPADVQTALDAITGDSGAIAKIKEEIVGKEGDVATANTVYGAKAYADSKIKALDAASVGGTGKVITTVSETDGVISATAIDLTATAVAATATAATDDKVAVTGTTVEAQIGSLAKSVKDTLKSAATYSVKKVTTGLATNVKEAYQLVETVNGTSTDVDVQIPVYKDSSLKSVELTDTDGSGKKGQFLKFTYIIEDGTESVVYLDCSKFLVESEFKNGLTVSDSGEVSVLVDADSESYLTVSASGVKVSGVDANIAKAKSVVEHKSGDAHVKVTNATAADGHIVYTVESVDTASAADLTAEITRANGAENTIEASVGLAEDGTHKATTGNYTSKATTIAGEIAALDTQVKTNADAITAEVTRATAAEEAIDAYVGKTEVPTGKTVMGVIIENEETAANAINTLAEAAGLIDSDDKVSYTAPTVSGEFSTTSSVMDMLNHIDAVWNTIDCGTY